MKTLTDEEKANEKIRNWKNAPRVTSLSGVFEDIASGRLGCPEREDVIACISLFRNNVDILNFYVEYVKFSGTFNRHFLASIPYILEEECRLGAALLKFLSELSTSENRMARLQTIEDAEAPIARTIVSLADGKVISLSNSPTAANKVEFELNAPTLSYFYLGSFFDINHHFLNSSAFSMFSDGFDVIYENTGFQMYGADRTAQIEFVLQNMASGGIFICLEKCLHTSHTEYQIRESQKDSAFKARYFRQIQLVEKQKIITEMENGQIYLDDLVSSIRMHLKHVDLIWNSGNFYIIAASNDRLKLDKLRNILGPVCIPDEYLYDQPRPLVRT